MALVGNLRLWTVQELVSSVLLCNHKSIQDETVRKVCENFQYLDMDIFVHILSGRIFMALNKKLPMSDRINTNSIAKDIDIITGLNFSPNIKNDEIDTNENDVISSQVLHTL